jgi:hypothetical protein
MSKKICLVSIGCNYKNSLVQLKGCINDAMDITETFIQICEKNMYEIDVNLLCDHDPNNFPSKYNILSLLEKKINLCNQGKIDNLIVYFAGHGNQYKDVSNDESDNLDESLLTADLQAIMDDELRGLIERNSNSNAQLTFIFDCCHSGTILDLPKIVIGSKSHNTRNTKNPNQKIICISACDDSESSIEKNGRGLFTQMFCNLLRKTNINKPIHTLLKNIKTFFQFSNNKMSLTVSTSKNLKFNKSNIFTMKIKNSKQNRGINKK